MLHLVPSASNPFMGVKGNQAAREQKEDLVAMQIKTSHWFILGDYVVGDFLLYQTILEHEGFFPVDFKGNTRQCCKIGFFFICD